MNLILVQRSDIKVMEEKVLKLLVVLPKATPTDIAKELQKSSQYVGRVLRTLAEKGLVSAKIEGRNRHYTPSMDAIMAYTEIA